MLCYSKKFHLDFEGLKPWDFFKIYACLIMAFSAISGYHPSQAYPYPPPPDVYPPPQGHGPHVYPSHGVYPPPQRPYPPPDQPPPGYQGCNNDQRPYYPPPPQPPPPYAYGGGCHDHHHGEDGCSGFLKGCLGALCCCCVLEECCGLF
ncbi:hypothetical protein GQ55_2G289800 [Panicum hallii var. hallii]|uniref:Uncharacterized protein n=1 Tax=Panicum hallii var. hallii TaxID=1504633 RepID=A0A2T7ETK0_9POAL|nr:hypothetical protein GQ55_2G289800 [Panicum hallii var. hallii]